MMGAAVTEETMPCQAIDGCTEQEQSSFRPPAKLCSRLCLWVKVISNNEVLQPSKLVQSRQARTTCMVGPQCCTLLGSFVPGWRQTDRLNFRSEPRLKNWCGSRGLRQMNNVCSLFDQEKITSGFPPRKTHWDIDISTHRFWRKRSRCVEITLRMGEYVLFSQFSLAVHKAFFFRSEVEM